MAHAAVYTAMAGEDDLRDSWTQFYRASAEGAIQDLLDAYPQQRSLYVDVFDLYDFDESFTRSLFSRPDRYLEAGAEALRGLNENFNRVNVRLTNHPGLLGIESLRSRHISELVSVEGVVKEIDRVQARASTAVFTCRRCGHRIKSRPKREVVAPPKCTECGGQESYEIDFDRSGFVDIQHFELESPSVDPTTAGPNHSIGAVVNDDLVGSISQGDHLLVTAIVRLDGQDEHDRFDLYLEVNSIDEEPGKGREPTDDVSDELRDAIASRWELLTDL